MKQWLFNPFIYIAGTKSLIIGWLVMAITACICFFSKTHLTGVIGLQRSEIIVPFIFYFIEVFVDWACLTLIFYFSGLIFSKSAIRFIDVAGTQALARWPMILGAVTGFGIKVPANIHNMPVKDLTLSISGSMLLFGLLAIILIIWMIALMYQAFKVSCNLKGSKATGVFIGGLIIGQVLSTIILHAIYNN
jgi:hypothetical protein